MSKKSKKEYRCLNSSIVEGLSDQEIFKYLCPTSNDCFHGISSNDLLDLMILLDDYYIEYRNSLGVSKNISFGMEIEFCKTYFGKVNAKLNYVFPQEMWRAHNDRTVDGELSTPILHDLQSDWNKFQNACDVLKSDGAEADCRTGGHVHVGAHVLGNVDKAWMNFFHLWSTYENIIFRFSNGEFVDTRRGAYDYASPIAARFREDYIDCLKGKYSFYITSKYAAVNLNHVFGKHDRKGEYRGNSIEFRCPNGTLDPIIWQNNTNLFVKLLICCRSGFDNDIVEKRYRKIESMKPVIYNYQDIFLDQALEFADLVFNNNLDKINFLKQYLKSFQFSLQGDKKEDDSLCPAKPMTRDRRKTGEIVSE